MKAASRNLVSRGPNFPKFVRHPPRIFWESGPLEVRCFRIMRGLWPRKIANNRPTIICFQGFPKYFQGFPLFWSILGLSCALVLFFAQQRRGFSCNVQCRFALLKRRGPGALGPSDQGPLTRTKRVHSILKRQK